MLVLNKKKIFMGAFLFTVTGGSLALLLKSQMVQLRHIEVEVNAGLWSRDLSESVKKSIVGKIKSFNGEPIWAVSLKDVVNTVQSDRRIREVFVQRRLPSDLKIKIELHKPLVLLMGVRGELLLVSRDANLFPPMGEAVDLPILRGMNFHRKKELRVQALQMLEEIPPMGLAGRQQISEIRFNKKFGYVLYLLPQGVQVRLGQSEFAQKINRVERVMKYLENQNMKYSVIDARFLKKVVVKPRKSS